MGINNLLGLVLAAAVLVGSVMIGNPNPEKLFDMHGLLIVLGGTFACVSVAFRLDRAIKMTWIFFRGFFATRVGDNREIIQEIVELAEVTRSNPGGAANKAGSIKDPFLKEAFQVYLDKVVDDQKLIRLLHSRVDTMYNRYTDEAKMFAACGKYPPAMGLMGAVLGMILLLGSLGTPGSETRIGPAMSVAMVATLYGIALANLFIIPIGENLQELARQIRRKNLIIVEGIKHISQKSHPMQVIEELNSFLLPSERMKWKKK